MILVALLWLQRVVHQSFVPAGPRTTQTSASMELASLAARTEVPSQSQEPPCSRVETIQRLVRKAGFSKAAAKVAAADLRRSTAALYQSKWSQFLNWCHRRGISLLTFTSLRDFIHRHMNTFISPVVAAQQLV